MHQQYGSTYSEQQASIAHMYARSPTLKSVWVIDLSSLFPQSPKLLLSLQFGTDMLALERFAQSHECGERLIHRALAAAVVEIRKACMNSKISYHVKQLTKMGVAIDLRTKDSLIHLRLLQISITLR